MGFAYKLMIGLTLMGVPQSLLTRLRHFIALKRTTVLDFEPSAPGVRQKLLRRANTTRHLGSLHENYLPILPSKHRNIKVPNVEILPTFARSLRKVTVIVLHNLFMVIQGS